MDTLFNRYADIYYDPKNPANLLDFQNRQLFLRIAARTVPDFVASLLNPTIPMIATEIENRGSLPAHNSPDHADYYSRLDGAIVGWARRFNIEIGWVIVEAYSIIFNAFRYQALGIDALEAFGTWRRPVIGTSSRSFQLPAWNPYAESEKKYILRANSEWRRLRNEHLVDVKAELSRDGAKSVPARRKRQFAAELRFVWAALHRCTGVSMDELADKYREDTEAIRVSVSRILKDLGFEPADPPT